MAFIRRKTIKGKTLYYLVENRREEGKVRQKVLAYLGKCNTVKTAIVEQERRLKKHQDDLLVWQAYQAKFFDQIPSEWIERAGGVVPKPKHTGAQLGNYVLSKYWVFTDIIASTKKHITECQKQIIILKQFVDL